MQPNSIEAFEALRDAVVGRVQEQFGLAPNDEDGQRIIEHTLRAVAEEQELVLALFAARDREDR